MHRCCHAGPPIRRDLIAGKTWIALFQKGTEGIKPIRDTLFHLHQPQG
jgi:hypothetical protein